MAASTRGHGDQAVSAFFDRLVGVLVVDHIVQDHAAVAVRSFVDLFARTQ